MISFDGLSDKENPTARECRTGRNIQSLFPLVMTTGASNRHLFGAGGDPSEAGDRPSTIYIDSDMLFRSGVVKFRTAVTSPNMKVLN